MSRRAYEGQADKFRSSGEFFSGLEALCGFDTKRLSAAALPIALSGGSEAEIVEAHFRNAAYAAAILYSVGQEGLRDLEKEHTVHPSTISGASLHVAMRAIDNYLLRGCRELAVYHKDQFEQLQRTCVSAKDVVLRFKGNIPVRF